MAKAGGKSITTWIRQSQAKVLASEYLGDPKFVEREILKGLADGEIPWRCVRFETPPQYSGPGPGDPKFWKIDPNELIKDMVFRIGGITVEGDSARRFDDVAAYGIEYDHGALVRLSLLPPAGDADGGGANAKWIAAEAKRMKTDGEIASGITKTKFAQLLEGQIKAAARRGDEVKPVGYRHIVNNLKDWGLWPISSI